MSALYPRRRPTSVDVARAASVSQATVARVFSSPELVADDTAQRVRHAAASLGYVPNAMARTLKSRRSDLIGLLVPVGGSYYLQTLDEFSHQLAKAGQQLLLFTFSDHDDLDRVLESVQRYELDGLVLASSAFGAERLGRLAHQGRRLVAYNQPDAVGILPTVSVDNAAGTSVLAELLIRSGHRDYVFVGGIRSFTTDQQRYRGAAQTLADHGSACPYVEAGDFTYDAGYRVAGELSARRTLPDAVIVASDEIAFGLIDGLRERGIRVPEDVSVTGHDGLPQASWAGYDLTTIIQPLPELVTATVDLLTQASSPSVSGPGDEHVVLPGRLRQGRTVRHPDA